MNKAWRAEVRVSPELACRLVSRQFPQLQPVQVAYLGEGWDNTVYQVNGKMVFRFPRRSIAIECLEAESRVLPHLQRLPIAVPNPLYLGKPDEGFPFPFTGYPMLPGVPAHMAHLDDRQRQTSSVRFGEFLRELHSMPIEDMRAIGARGDTIGRMDLEKRRGMFNNYLENAVQQGLVENPRPFHEVLRELPNSKVREQFSLVHGDLNFRNFLVNTEGSVSGVIDWGDVHIGHPAVDLAIAHSFLPPEARSQFRDAYGDVDDESWLLAKFRAVYTNLYILVYAHDIRDTHQFEEARTALDLIFRD